MCDHVIPAFARQLVGRSPPALGKNEGVNLVSLWGGPPTSEPAMIAEQNDILPILYGSGQVYWRFRIAPDVGPHAWVID